MIERTLFGEDHERLRSSVRRFLANEVTPYHLGWEDRGYVDRKLWTRAGEEGFLCPTIAEKYGGSGTGKTFSVAIAEEIARSGASGLGWFMHSDIVAPYIEVYGSDELKARYLPRMVTGELVGAIAMTEPSAGSDLKNIRTTATTERNDFVVNGSKTFITNGWHCDLVIVALKTDPSLGSKGISLLVVEASTPGFCKGKLLKKSGMRALDTTELFFSDMRVPRQNLLGGEGDGLSYLMQQLPWERLQAAVYAVAASEAALEKTISYARERRLFDRELLAFQNTRFVLAELKTELQILRVFIDRCIELVLQQKLDSTTASMAKYRATEIYSKTADACIQLHGGYGYMQEYSISRSWADAAIFRLAGGANELMKELIARSL